MTNTNQTDDKYQIGQVEITNDSVWARVRQLEERVAQIEAALKGAGLSAYKRRGYK